MKVRAAIITVALLVAACGAGPVPIATPDASLPSATTIPPSTTEPVPTSEEGVAVTITASAVTQPNGSVELCPPGTTGPCPGIVLDGEIDPAMISNDGDPVVIQVTGTYDGSALAPSSAPEAIDYPLLAEPEFDSRCPELRGTPSVNPAEQLQAAIGGYVEQQPAFVEMWWDRETAVLTVWFKGDDVSVHQDAIDALAAGEPVCVAGGARFSRAELDEASNLIQGFRDSAGQPLATPGYAVGGLENRINLFVEQIDAPTRDALTELVGDRVVVFPFIELLEDDLAAMPSPRPIVEGDVEILTSSVRNAGGMAALGYFTVNYDPAMNCIYFTEPSATERMVPVWPFGYSATSNPVTVYDFDGAATATEGDQLELGGGNVGVGPLEGNTCGADSAWIVSTF